MSFLTGVYNVNVQRSSLCKKLNGTTKIKRSVETGYIQRRIFHAKGLLPFVLLNQK